MPAAKQRPDPQKSLVGFTVGEVAYAVSIASVKEIVNPVTLTALPHAPAAIAGVADHRGQVVPVIDLRVRFGLSRLQDNRRSKWILVEVEGQTVGMVVDQVTEVFGTGGTELRPAPAFGEGDDARGITGVTTHEGVLTFVLDLGRFRDLMQPLAQSGLLASSRGM
ncbi:MAG: purine-binding chemotaxis protein CheW [Polyangiaceae bacterium]|nr:purine-binding chemotaxis protein CheW [Polyangiaceae bacterium]